MKKRLLALGLVFAMALSVTACGKQEEAVTEEKPEKEETTVKDIEYNVDDIVTLGDYKGIEVTLDGEYEFTEEGLADYIQSQIDSAAIFVADDSQKEVQEDSIVNVDYVGSQDDVPFDGGSAEDQTIDVAGNCMAGSTSGFIDGFTSGLPGNKVGDEVAYEVTFPDNYGNTDLAGQTVIFTFQINYIAKAISSVDDLTDEIVSDKFGVDTVAEYKEKLENDYKESLENNLKNDKETAVLNALINNCKVGEIPEDLLQARLDLIIYIQDLQYKAYGTTMKEYVEQMGYNYDDIISDLKENVKESTETELILEAIAKAEGLEVDEKGYKEFIQKILNSMGYTDETKFYEDFSVDGFDGERYFRLAYLTEKATSFCIDNAVVNATSTIAD